MSAPRTQSSFESALENSYWREADARVVLSEFSASGDTLSDFCRRHGLTMSRVVRWRDRFRTEAREGKAPEELRPMDFVEFHVTGKTGPNDATAMEVLLSSGRRLILGPGFDAEAVARLVVTLDGLSC